MGQTTPDYSIDFTQLASLPAGVTATAANLSSKGAYVSNADQVIRIALATVAPSLTASSWSAEVDITLDANPGSAQRTFLEFGGTTNNRFTLGLSDAAPNASLVWSNVSTVPSLDVKSGSQPGSGVPTSFTVTVSGTGTNANFAVNNNNLVATGAVQAVSGALSLNLGAIRSLNQGYLFGWIKAVRVWVTPISTARVRCLSPRSIRDVVCWGDSLTQGAGASPSSMGYVTQLATLANRQTINKGVSGESSTQIKARFFSDADRTRALINVFWVGRNNLTPPATVLTDLNDMISRLGHNRFLVLSVINKSDGTENAGSAAYNNILALNAAIAAAYPANYLDVRSSLVADSGGANDAPAPSITADGLHLNTAGYTLVAGYVREHLPV